MNKLPRGRPSQVPFDVLFTLGQDGISNEFQLEKKLTKTKEHLRKILSELKHRGLVRTYPNPNPIKNKRGRHIDKGSNFVLKKLGRPFAFYGLTEKGIELVIRDKRFGMKSFWNILFNYFSKKSGIKIKISDLVESYLKSNLGINKELAIGHIFSKNFELDLSSIAEKYYPTRYNFDKNSYNEVEEYSKNIHKNMNREDIYFDILYQIFVSPFEENELHCFHHDKKKILEELEEQLLIQQTDSKPHLYLLTLFGFLIVIDKIHSLAFHGTIPDSKNLSLLYDMISKGKLEQHLFTDDDQEKKEFNDGLISLWNDKLCFNYDTYYYEPTLFGFATLLALDQVKKGDQSLHKSPRSKKDVIFQIMKEPYCHPLGGSTWERAMFTDILLRPSMMLYEKYFHLILPKWKFLKQFTTSENILGYLGASYHTVDLNEHESIVFESGFQEIFNDLNNLLNFYEGTLKKFRDTGDKIQVEQMDKFLIKFHPELKQFVHGDYDEETNEIYEKVYDKLEPEFESEFKDVLVQLKVFGMLLGNSWREDKKLKKLLFFPLQNSISDLITFKFYTRLFSETKRGVIEKNWFKGFSSDKELVDLFNELHKKIIIYQEQANET